MHELFKTLVSSRAVTRSSSSLRMAASPLPSAETVQKAAVSALAALMVAFSPLQAAIAAEVAPASPELSPAQMLVKETTDVQVSLRTEMKVRSLSCSTAASILTATVYSVLMLSRTYFASFFYSP